MKITYDYQSFCAGWLVSGLILSPAALAEIDRNMESRGAGWAETIIQAAASPGSILQRAGFIQQSRSLTLRHLTVRHGYAEGSGSVSRRDRGVCLDGGERELEHVAMVANRSRGDGGTICSTVGTVSATHVNHLGNRACQFKMFCGDGGAIRNFNGSLAIFDSLLRSNEAGSGGAIYSIGSNVSVSETNVALTGNLAVNLGGATAEHHGAKFTKQIGFHGCINPTGIEKSVIKRINVVGEQRIPIEHPIVQNCTISRQGVVPAFVFACNAAI